MSSPAEGPAPGPPIQVDDLSCRASDGTALACRLWQPAGGGSWPTLLMRQPYGRAIASTVTYAHPHWYASHGYAVLVQDVRGRGGSEGPADGSFAGFAQEAADGAATLSWIRQQPWCNGRVGSYGFSYQGLTQLLSSDPAQLPDALAPAMAGLEERRHWAAEGGCHWWGLGLAWALQLAAQGCRRRGDAEGWQALRSSLESGSFLANGLELLRRHDPQAMGLAWLERDAASDEGWVVHEPPADLWRRPMLLIGGWYDPHLAGVLDLWQRARRAGGEPLLRIGAWNHLNWRGGIDRLQLAFFDRHLKGAEPPNPAGQRTPAALLQDQLSGHWRGRSPRRSSGQVWGLRSTGLAAVDPEEGALSAGEGTGGGTVVLVHDPWRPLPGRGGHLGLDAGPAERGDLDNRADVACFNSAPLAGPLELLGQPLLTLQAAADQPGFDLCLALSRLGADGTVQQLCTGVARWLGDDCRQLQPRRVVMQPLLATLAQGDRLRLAIGLAAWPQIAVNPGSGERPSGPAGPGHREITVTLQLDGTRFCIEPMVGAN
ncbi:MAG: CocE/NonD family hydrolase [Vulcanococcus sp.]